MTEQIKFQVETKRILEILSREIYDSPIALLRENVQNAYDAVLMRCARDGIPQKDGVIEIDLTGSTLNVKDNGIGMTEQVLRENFWKAGSSGKHGELAHKAGVIGTFGIGAMANFGIATSLEITTRSSESAVTLRSIANRDTLSIAEDCITLERTADNREQGTLVAVTFEPGVTLTPQQAKNYLVAYIQFVPVQIKLNGQLISQNVLNTSVPFSTENLKNLGKHSANDGLFSCDVEIGVTGQGLVRAEVTNVSMSGTPLDGSLLLSQGSGNLMGYRNYFGLAPVPISTFFQLGGVANLSFLTPTAGREALSRESIVHVQRLVAITEKLIAQEISKSDIADRSPNFQNYLVANNRFDLSGNITVQVHPEKEAVPLSNLRNYCKGKNIQYYVGNDPMLLRQFATPESALCLLYTSPSPRD